MGRFEGKCVGGPLDGQMLAHWSKSKKLMSPVVMGLPVNWSSAQISSVEIGEYRLNNFEQWHWWETDAGRALRILQAEVGGGDG